MFVVFFLIVLAAPSEGLNVRVNSTISFASVNMIDYYASEWSKVDSAIAKGLPKTALEIVGRIYKRARSERNNQQIIKAVTYRVALHAEGDEYSDARLVNDLRGEVSASAEPVRSVLQSIMAEMYWQYYRENRWRIRGRTKTADKLKSDFETWDAATLYDSTAALYIASLEHASELQAIPVASFSEVLLPGMETEGLRPTLYDILVHRAIDFFRTEEFDLPEAEDAFELASIDIFKPAAEFASMRFHTSDPNDPVYLSVVLQQDLVRHLLARNEPGALIDAELFRLGFMHDKCVHYDKDTAYYKALEHMLAVYGKDPEAARIMSALAKYHFDKDDYVRAMEFCNRAIDTYPRSIGVTECAVLKSNILVKSLSMRVEETVLPGAPILVHTGYRNLATLWFRVYKLDDSWQAFLDTHDDWKDQLAGLLRSKCLKSWKRELPATADFKTHGVDIDASALPAGRYVLLASPREDFAIEGNAIGYVVVNATRLSWQSQTLDNGNIIFRVHDAMDGAPIEGATLVLYKNEWLSRSRTYKKVTLRKLTTGKDGSARLADDMTGESFGVDLRYHDEYIGSSDMMYHYYKEKDRETRRRSMLFTDRSLYRPGQSIYFKGIVIEQNDAAVRYNSAAGIKTRVTLYDANHQKVTELQLMTNRFGSYSGTFTAPAGTLTGMMTISDDWNSVHFRVEEYKRPKFEVNVDKPKGTYSLDDTVGVRGNAKAYAGSNIDGAKAVWRVVRRARYPYWRCWWIPMPSSPEREIAHGIAATDAQGAFEIQFAAVPDRSIDPKTLPVFTYTVQVDVTDINGETHSGETGISVGYTEIALSVGTPVIMERLIDASASIMTTNLNGLPLAVSGTLTLEHLKTPGRLMRKRQLPKADVYLLSETEFVAAFPNDVYKNEDVPENWTSIGPVVKQGFATDTAGRFEFPLKDLDAGIYKLTTLVRDGNGNDIVMTRVFTVYDKAGSEPVAENAVEYVPPVSSYEPGSIAEFRWGTSLRNAHVLYQIEKRGKIVSEEWITMNNEVRTFSIPVTENDRGDFSAHLFMVRNYRMYDTPVTITVPWTNKQLRIETTTFRDKLLPGQDEQWRLTISGSKRDAVAAELVAGMYDASLDAIYKSGWPGFSWPYFGCRIQTSSHTFDVNTGKIFSRNWYDIVPSHSREYPALRLFLLGYGRHGYRQKMRMMAKGEQVIESSNALSVAGAAPPAATKDAKDSRMMDSDASLLSIDESRETKDKGGETGASSEPGLENVKARTNFNETAFFFPQLMTNEKNEVVLSFTIPEALTRWKLRVFAHTTDMQTGTLEKSCVTQKDLMVMPNAPRFMREGDRMVFPIKITNMSGEALRGTARLSLFDAVTMKPLDADFKLKDADKSFSVEGSRSTTVQWALEVPVGVSAVVYRVVAKCGEYSDGEEAPLPVLPNRMLVTETLPLNVRGNQTKSFTFDKLISSGSSPTLRQHRLTLEMTSNPAWYAVQALPYLIEYPYECSEQVFNRFYGNSIASHLVNSNPKIERVFEQWKNAEALVSNLEKNQELKSILLQETPWVMQSGNETERKKRIALLFDLNTMSRSLSEAVQKLAKAQNDNGGWPWFPGMPESRYITQYIVAGFGHLRALGIEFKDSRVQTMIRQAVEFIDEEMKRDYDLMKRQPRFNPKDDHLGFIDIQYLYARSFFKEYGIPEQSKEGFEFWIKQSRDNWLRQTLMQQGMIALSLSRFDDGDVPHAIVRSLSERALHNDEMGMYWKQERSWYRHLAPIETQALLVEVYDEVAKDPASVEELKIWLLKQKQVQDWGNTIATAEACYALLKRGSDLLASDKLVEVTMGGKVVDPRSRDDVKVEAGTGHYKMTWSNGEIQPEMGKVTLTKRDSGIAWGALFWQYYEQLDKITFAKSPLWIKKSMYRQNMTAKGVVLEPVTEASPLHVGDMVTVRVEIRVDRDMEYVHLKDMRGAGLELVNQLSIYKWQGGLGYYEAPKDASVNFFIHWLSKGTYVFEYPLRVSHEGRFSNGISSIQCMYAPEFAGHTEGTVVTVSN
jgi:hypothetical protein